MSTSLPITVVKIGGSVLGKHEKALDDIAYLTKQGHRFVLVHGGSRLITSWTQKILDEEPRIVRGLRVTPKRTLDIVVAVLGLVNKELVADLQGRGIQAYGLSGADAAILQGERYSQNLGFVGRVTSVDKTGLLTVAEAGGVAVLAPFAIEEHRNGNGARPSFLNVNADTAAGEVAAALGAERLVMLTDVDGIRGSSGAVLAQVSASELEDLVASGTVSGGMIPKVEAALRAASTGVPTTIIDGRQAGHLRELVGAGSSDRVGTTVYPRQISSPQVASVA